MANTESPAKQSYSFAISYGFVEGPAHGRELSKLLRQAGYTQASSGDEADIVIGHSAGCWLIPIAAKPRLTIYVGMPLAPSPRQAWLKANLFNLQAYLSTGRLLHGAHMGLLNIYYGLGQFNRNMRIFKMARNTQPNLNKPVDLVFIVNQHDPWPQSEKLPAYVRGTDWAFISLPGAHENIWQDPEHYVAIINHYARLLA